jgi:hypothetical protein
VSRGFDAEHEFDRRREELLAQASLHRACCTKELGAAAVVASRDHPRLWLAAGVGLGAAAVVVVPAALRATGAVSGSLFKIAAAGARLVALSLRRGV